MGFEGIATQTGGDSPVAILAPYGEITSENVSDMEKSMDSLLRDFAQLVIDFTHTSYVSSAGWRTLIDRCRHVRQPIRVAGMQCTVRDVYDLLGLNYVIAAHDTVAEAVAAFNAERVRPITASTRPEPA